LKAVGSPTTIYSKEGTPLQITQEGHLQVAIAGAESGSGALDTNLKSSEIVQPSDLQARYSRSITTHNAVSINGTTNALSTWQRVEGFDRLTLLIKGNFVEASLNWSSDGVSTDVTESLGSTTPISVEIASTWVQVKVTTASAETVTSKIYLKV
jgi:hypothetical protein